MTQNQPASAKPKSSSFPWKGLAITAVVIYALLIGMRELIISSNRSSCDFKWADVPHEYKVERGYLFHRGICLVEVNGQMVPADKAVFTNHPAVPAE